VLLTEVHLGDAVYRKKMVFLSRDLVLEYNFVDKSQSEECRAQPPKSYGQFCCGQNVGGLDGVFQWERLDKRGKVNPDTAQGVHHGYGGP